MLFEKINLEKELVVEKNRAARLVAEAKDILLEGEERDRDALERLKTGAGDVQEIELDELDRKQVYSSEEIKVICIKYRLRFLDTKHYKAGFPYEALQKINVFEKKYNCKTGNFKIVAPDTVFELEDINKDPLLFLQLPGEKYLLLHKWGNDLAWYRGILSYPLRNIYSYFFSIVLLAAIVAFSIPGSWMHMADPDAVIRLKLWLTVHCFIALFFFIIFLGSLTAQNFSEVTWQSRHFNT